MLQFIEEQTIGYKARTIKNASADATIAIAKDFNTPGEILALISNFTPNLRLKIL